MGKIIEVPIMMSDDAREKSSLGIARVETWEQPERLQRALKIGGILFGLAVLSVFLPGLHWILVPSLLLATPIVAWKTYSQESVVMGGGGPCPKCGAEFQLARAKNVFPMNDLCTKCSSNVRVEISS